MINYTGIYYGNLLDYFGYPVWEVCATVLNSLLIFYSTRHSSVI